MVPVRPSRRTVLAVPPTCSVAPGLAMPFFGYNRPDATKLAKIHDLKTGEVMHRMGDVGYLDDRGRLWFCGRKSHRVVTRGVTLYTIPCEAVFNTHPKVLRSALVGVHRNGASDSQVPHLTTFLGFLGLTDVTFVYSEGHGLGPEAVAKAKAQADAEVEAALS